jgi:hypothetical protein
VTVKYVFPLPLIEECLDTLAGNIWYSKLDANSTYWQVGCSNHSYSAKPRLVLTAAAPSPCQTLVVEVVSTGI